MRFARSLAWTAVVLSLGSMSFGIDRTGAVLLPMLHPLAALIGAQVSALHVVLRNAAHFAEYAILATLWFHALAWRRRVVTASWIALCVCLACAVADEAHQSLLANRTGRARDVVLDTTGAVVVLGLAAAYRARRIENRPTSSLVLLSENGTILSRLP